MSRPYLVDTNLDMIVLDEIVFENMMIMSSSHPINSLTQIDGKLPLGHNLEEENILSTNSLQEPNSFSNYLS